MDKDFCKVNKMQTFYNDGMMTFKTHNLFAVQKFREAAAMPDISMCKSLPSL